MPSGPPRGGPPPARAGVPKKRLPATTEADSYTVDLQSGGRVTVSVSMNIFDLSTTDREFVIDLVDRLKGYPQVQQPDGGHPSEEASAEQD